MNEFIQHLESRRLFAFGDLDSTFGTAGTKDDAAVETLSAPVVLPNGRIVAHAAGDQGTSSAGLNQLRRYTTSGNLDTSFSSDGIVPLAAGTDVLALFATADNKTIALTRLYNSQESVYQLFLTRYTAGGAVDTSYGANGSTVFGNTDESFSQFHTHQAADGSIFVSQTPDVNTGETGGNYASELFKFDSGGDLDGGFGTGGRLQLSGGSPITRISAITTATDGSLRLTGTDSAYTVRVDPDSGDSYIDVTSTRAFIEKRSAATGDLSTAFGTNGRTTIALPSVQSDLSVAVERLASNRALVAYSINGRTQLIRVNADGTTNVSTNNAGPLDLNFVFDLTALPDGRVFAYGLKNNAIPAIALVDSPTGTRPTLANLIEIATVGGIYANTTLSAPAVGPDGKLVSAGRVITDTNDDGQIDATDAQYNLTRLLPGSASDARPDNITNAQQNSTAFGPDNSFHVAYYDAATKTLKYKWRDSAGRWKEVENIDTAANTGEFLSLSVAPNGQVGVAYFEGTSGDLKYAVRDDTNDNWSRRTVKSKGSVGLYPSLKYSFDSRPYITYYNKTTGDLELAAIAEGSQVFSFESIDGGGEMGGNVGRHSSLNINPFRGTFEVAYAGEDGTVRFAERKAKGGKGWAISVAATTTGGVGGVDLDYETIASNSQDLESAAQPTLIAYYDAGPADARIARRAAGGSVFSSTRVASKGSVGLYPNVLNLRGNGEPTSHAAFYYDRTRDRVISVFDRTPGNDGSAPLDNGILFEGGGKYLTLANSRFGALRTMAFQDTASGQLFVRDA